MNVTTRSALVALALAAACAGNPDPETEPEMVAETPVRIAPPLGAVQPGDCPEAVRRAVAKPDIAVDRLATPKAPPMRRW